MHDPGRRHREFAGGNAAALAREEVRRFMDDALVCGHLVPPALWDAALLVTSELVTNAVRHTPGPCSLDVSWSQDGIDIAVTDPSPDAPRLRPPGLMDGTGGYGWPLIHRLASEVDIDSTPPGGKTIHVHVPGTA
ncbi:ATP-binding protein [Streptomyces sp. NRRL S-87]|uniref:ATP-binding protein n=1 Tax=Streptomyces sp. NRRL S-87 TaxID=1463920 RepID=UPI0004BF42DE|nr:ATP-binding protein [Streptomyces sp. NRRL S-87]